MFIVRTQTCVPADKFFYHCLRCGTLALHCQNLQGYMASETALIWVNA